jgi:hypothetical protein
MKTGEDGNQGSEFYSLVVLRTPWTLHLKVYS